MTGDANIDHWMREESCRNAILQGLQDCKDDDIIFISDLDEIPSAEAVLRVKEHMENLNKIKWFQKKKKTTYHQFVCTLDMRLFVFQLNYENKLRWRHGSKAIPFWFLEEFTPWEIKIFHNKYSDMHVIENAGWHFNTMGGKEKALYKWFNTGPLFNNEPNLLKMKEDEALLEEAYQGHVSYYTVIVPIDDSYPQYILNNLEYFRSLGWITDD